jgi:hypothetical protein
MWKEMNRILGLNIPEDQIERLAPALDTLRGAAREVFGRDLGLTEPVIVFRADPGAGK